MELLQALIIGLLGSMHCIGMCGPIAIALPLKDRSWTTRLISNGLYHAGKSITYALLGFLFGWLGRGLYLGGVQQWVSIGMGVIMLLSVIFPLLFSNTDLAGRFIKPFAGFKSLFANTLKVRTYFSLFIIGLLNGLLPCGLVYLALAGAVLRSNAIDGALYMLVFGIGTMPAMLGLSLAGRVIGVQFRQKIRKFIPWFIVLLGILFILRGLNLGIPYLSPEIEKHSLKAKCCH